MNRASVTLLALVSLLALALPGLARQDQTAQQYVYTPADSPEVFGSVRDFEFEERRGGTVSKESLQGTPWLVGCIFTRCSTICPAMTQEMSKATLALEGTGAKVVALTIDPENDTAEVLTEFASHFPGGDSEDWLWLRGSEGRVHALILGSFKLSVGRMEGADPGLEFAHSSKLIAIDGDGNIRGYYDSTDPGGTEAAIARMRFLAGVPEPEGASSRSFLPTLNAIFNSTAAVLLMAGLFAIKAGRKKRHEHLMKLAFLVSAAFLASYLYYHFVVVPAQGGPVKFDGEGTAKTAYYVLLLTHVLGAIVNLPMVLRTFWLAHKERWDDHKRWAKWTFPLWMYVSVTGVMVYVSLYVL